MKSKKKGTVVIKSRIFILFGNVWGDLVEIADAKSPCNVIEGDFIVQSRSLDSIQLKRTNDFKMYSPLNGNNINIGIWTLQ